MAKNEELQHAPHDDKPGVIHWLVLQWVLMLILGTIIVGLPGSLQSSQQVSFNRSFFTAVNLSTLTGFPATFARPDDFRLSVQVIFLLQMLSGLCLSLIGGGIMINQLLGRRHRESNIIVCGLAIIIFAGAMGIATNDPGQPLISGIQRGLGALGGSALEFGDRFPSSLMHAVFIPLSIFGTMGTFVLCDLYDMFYRRKSLSQYSLAVLSTIAGLYIILAIGFGLIFKSLDSIPRAGELAGTSLGYGRTYEIISQLPRSIFWLIVSAMCIGTGAAGTGGFGIAWLWTLPQRFLKTNLMGIGMMLLFAVLGLISISYTATQLNTEQSLMLTFGSLSSLGIPFTTINLSNSGLSLFGLLMIIGRLMPLIVLNEMTTTNRQTDA